VQLSAEPPAGHVGQAGLAPVPLWAEKVDSFLRTFRDPQLGQLADVLPAGWRTSKSLPHRLQVYS